MKLPQEGYDDSRARRLYGKNYDDSDGYFYGPGDYQPIIDSFGTVLVQKDDNDYQGDTRVLLEKDGRFGFLNFGWGSCSGCDGLQACSSFRDIEELIRGLENDIKWFDTLQAAKDYILSNERKQSYYWHEAEWEDFCEQVRAYVVPADKLAELQRENCTLRSLLTEARAAIEPLTAAQIKLHHIKRDLADRIDAALGVNACGEGQR